MSREKTADIKIINHYYNLSGNDIPFEEFKLEYDQFLFGKSPKC